MKRIGIKINSIFFSLTFLGLLLQPVTSHADPGDNYCVQPAFISNATIPNLLLMIDNSASMYDLAFTDSSNKYCANAPTTACTSDATCASAGASSCKSSQGAMSSTTYSGKACTTDANCPNTAALYTAKACTSNSQCTASGSKCNSGFCSKCVSATGAGDCVAVPKCSGNVCRGCNTSTGVGDCTSTTNVVYNPISCSSDSQCTSGGGTCPAGNTCTWVAGDTCNNKCTSTRQCYDTTYSDTRTYTGYFDSTAIYRYDFTNDKFISGASMPASCTYSAGSPQYFCVNTTGSGTSEVIVEDTTGFVAKGNFLNWLSASKFDIEKKILTGGKFDTTGNVLIGESRGCAGRKFIKSVPGVNLTFAIRGGTPGGVSSTQNQATEYGQTYIEISTGVYNAADCLSAMNDWMTLTTAPTNLGSFQNDTKGCVGAGNSTYNAVNIWNHILHDCYNGVLGKAQGYSTNLGPLEGECKSAYATVAPSAITDPNSGISICSSVLTYTDAGGNSQTGYLGACYNTGTGAFDDTCAQTQMANFCTLNVNTTPVVDPSSTGLQGAGSSAPGFILEQGLMNTNRIYTFTVKIAQSTAPTGIINNYGEKIRFGAMTFQNNGSATECGAGSVVPCSKACSVTTTRICYVNTDCPTGETCTALAKTDGGKIISYVGAGQCSITTATACVVDSDCPSGEYCKPSVGSHSTGLIKAIDDIPAVSWTPFAEAFYDAIGYFARTNAYTASPPTSRSDANFNALPSPNTATSYDAGKNPSQYRCQKNNIMLVTDGMSTADQNTQSEALATLYASQVPYTIGGTTYNPGDALYDSTKVHGYDTCPPYKGSRSLSDLAWVAKHRNIKTLVTSGTASTTAPSTASESITTYAVYFGPQSSGQPGLCDPLTFMSNTATNGGTSLYQTSSISTLYGQLDAALLAVSAQASSGTAASILSNSEGSGATILQALFYPTKYFENDASGTATSANWLGEMHNLWYYVDPQISNSTIREDTVTDAKLNLKDDYLTNFYFDPASNQTVVQLQRDVNGDGKTLVNTGATLAGRCLVSATTVCTTSSDCPANDSCVNPKNPDLVKSLWRAGRMLWARDLDSTPRNIKTTINGTSLINFSAANASILEPYLQATPEVTHTEAYNIVRYLNGTDISGYRNRTVKIRYPDPVTGPITSGVWKLGDIISSTPRLQSSVRQNTYDILSPNGYGDASYASYIGSTNYKNRGMVYVGANDGMLHAFNLGTLNVTASGLTKASLTGSNLGSEQWAFIPRSALPYLKYMTDEHYNHIYSVDGSTVIFDASIGIVDGCTGTYDTCVKNTKVTDNAGNLDPTKNNWRSIVIGGMGIGGASSMTCTTGTACVPTPTTIPGDNSMGLGYSSYFALDVTDPNNPSLLWEFNDPELGYSTTGPAIVRLGDSTKNGKWYAVFASGPTGPIDTIYHQFLASSNQKLTFFIVDIATGAVIKAPTNIDNAFAGSMIGGSIDADRGNTMSVGNYQDDAIYVGYVQANTGSTITPATTWTNGGVLRLTTGSTANTESLVPNDAANPWKLSKVISGIGPVTTKISRLQDSKNKNLWLYFGTGRYFYRQGTVIDDNEGARALYGIKEPCYNTASHPGNILDKTCTTERTETLTNQSGTPSPTATYGWYINLDDFTTSFGAERVVTDTVALTNGQVFFTSFKPTTDPCGFGGNSYLWGVQYDTGGPITTPLQGKALIQLSTGEFKQEDLSNTFTDRENRKMGAPMTGKPPTDAPPVLSKAGNKPVKRIIHIQER